MMENVRKKLSFKQTPLGAYDSGKLPPQALDLEQMVLGSIMAEKSFYTIISDLLSPSVFYKEANSIIFGAIETLATQGSSFEFMMVIAELKKQENLEIIGGMYYVTLLMEKFTVNPNTIKEACLIMKEKHMKREIIRMSSNMIEEGYDDGVDVFDLLDKAQTHLNNIVYSNMITMEASTTELFTELNKHIDKSSKLNDSGKLSGVPTSLSELNKITGGWQKSNMITVASRPSMGKSAFTKALIKGVVQNNESVLMFSLEMPSIELTARFASEIAHISAQDILAGKCIDVIGKINEAPTQFYDEKGKELLIIDDTASLSIRDLKNRAKRIISIHKPKLIIIDYIQLLRGTNERQNREQEISEISRGIKVLAKETGLPIIALSQLNREAEKRNPPRPKLADLRESGSIEQDSDIVIFLYRPWYYYKQRKDESFSEQIIRGEETSTERFAELIIAKHRMGALRNIPVKFTDYLTMFEDWPQSIQEDETNVKSPVKEIEDDLPF